MSLQLIQTALKAHKGQTNTFGNYSYRSCEDILEAVKPLLAQYEMVLTLSDEVKSVADVPQMVITDEKTKPKTKTLSIGTVAYIEATATITKAGELVAQVKGQAGIDINKAGMDVAQCFGASSSYARKYALNGLFCIDDTKDADATNQHDKGDNQRQTPQENNRPPADPVNNAVADLARELKDELLAMSMGNAEEAADRLKELTAFGDNNEKWMKYDQIEQCSEKWLKQTLAKAKKAGAS